MHVHGSTQIHGPQGINPPHHPRLSRTEGTSAAAGAAGDQLEISPAAEAAIRAAETGQMRSELVSSIRSQIAAGTYETPEKLDVALDRLLDEIA